VAVGETDTGYWLLIFAFEEYFSLHRLFFVVNCFDFDSSILKSFWNCELAFCGPFDFHYWNLLGSASLVIGCYFDFGYWDSFEVWVLALI
jgi:hypothetical protein